MVNRVVISTTVVGTKEENMIDINKVSIGDKVLITKYAAIEGTSIIAKELEDYLEDKIGRDKVIEAQNMGELVSVVKEGILLGKIGVNHMHDITEGGILGAVWEGAVATNKGIKIYENLIPMKEVTREIASLLNIDPYKLISSGSMLVIAKEDKIPEIKENWQKKI